MPYLLVDRLHGGFHANCSHAPLGVFPPVLGMFLWLESLEDFIPYYIEFFQQGYNMELCFLGSFPDSN